MEQGNIYIQISSYYGEESDRCLCIVQHGQQNHLCWPVVKAILVHRENPRPMDVVMNGWLRLP